MAHTVIHDENEGESASPRRMIRKVVRVTTKKDQPSDYQYWITRPVAERIDAIEMLRQSYLSFRTDVPPRLQRVYRVTQQSRG